MQNFGLADLGYVILAGIFGYVFILSDIPAAIVRNFPAFARRYFVKSYQDDNDNPISDDDHYVTQEETTVPVSPLIPPVSDTDIAVDTAKLATQLTEEQAIEVLARMRNPHGKFIFSGKKLYTLAGGNYNEFVVKMRKMRGDEPDTAPEEPTILTPIAGRPTKASYYEADPELAYRPLEETCPTNH